MYCVEREEMVYSVYLLPAAGKPGVEKTGFVYADAETVHLARLTCYTLSLYLLSNVNTYEK